MFSNATSGRYAVLTSQFALPAAINSAMFALTTLYLSNASNHARMSLSSDGVFGDNRSAQLAQQTPTFTGDVTAAYTATAVIGIAR